MQTRRKEFNRDLYCNGDNSNYYCFFNMVLQEKIQRNKKKKSGFTKNWSGEKREIIKNPKMLLLLLKRGKKNFS